MDSKMFYGQLTENEVEKQLELKIEKLKKINETGPVNATVLKTNFGKIDDFVNELAYKSYVCGGLPEATVKSEIRKILEQVSETCKISDMEESIELEHTFSDYAVGEKESPNNSDSVFNFNDTLEEIERALNEGLDYRIAGSEDSNTTKLPEHTDCSTESDIINTKNNKLIEQDVEFIESEPLLEDCSQIIESLSCDFDMHRPEENCNINNLSPLKVTSKSTADSFLKPKGYSSKTISPSMKKHCNPGSSRSNPRAVLTPSNRLYRDVASPVAFYIKNSGTVPLQRNWKYVSEKNIKSHTLCPVNKFPSAKSIVLPEVSYKPACNRVVSKEVRSKFPENINKLVGKRPEIIIHEIRISGKKQKEVSSKLFDSLADFSISNNDTSVYLIKEAIIP